MRVRMGHRMVALIVLFGMHCLLIDEVTHRNLQGWVCNSIVVLLDRLNKEGLRWREVVRHGIQKVLNTVVQGEPSALIAAIEFDIDPSANYWYWCRAHVVLQ